MSEQIWIQPSSTSEQEYEIDLLELAKTVLNKWKRIVLCLLIGGFLAIFYTIFLVTPMYEATSMLYVLNRNDSAINLSDLQLGSALAKDYVKVFEVWEVHEEVISNLGLPYTYEEMQDMLTVSNYADTRMLEITVTSPSAQEAAEIANEYANVAREYIADAMATEKPNILSVALVPNKPVSPSKLKNTIIGALLGAVLACCTVVIAYLTDDKVKTEEDIRKYTGLVTLAVVPAEDISCVKNDSRRKR